VVAALVAQDVALPMTRVQVRLEATARDQLRRLMVPILEAFAEELQRYLDS